MSNNSPFRPFGKNGQIRNQPPVHDELAERLQRSRFADALAAGVTGVVDRFGTRIEKDHMVLCIPPPQHHLWQVKDVAPAVGPNVPVGVVTVTLELTLPLMAQAGSQIPSLVVYGKALGEGHLQIGPPAQQEQEQQESAAQEATQQESQSALNTAENTVVDAADRFAVDPVDPVDTESPARNDPQE